MARGFSKFRFLELLLLGINRNAARTASQAFILHKAVYFGEQGIVPAHAYVITGPEVGTALTNQNATSRNFFTAKDLDTQPLRVAITTVFLLPASTFNFRHDLILSMRKYLRALHYTH
jgi:hypothetical protein